MYLEADTRHDVTHIYTATCTGAAETSWQAEQAVRLYLQTYTYRAFLSISVILLIFGLYFNEKNQILNIKMGWEKVIKMKNCISRYYPSYFPWFHANAHTNLIFTGLSPYTAQPSRVILSHLSFLSVCCLCDCRATATLYIRSHNRELGSQYNS